MRRHCEQARQFLKEKLLIGVLLTVSEDISITITVRSVVAGRQGMVLEWYLRALHPDLQVAGRERYTSPGFGLWNLKAYPHCHTTPNPS